MDPSQRTTSPERRTRSPERKTSPERKISPERTISPTRMTSCPKRGVRSPSPTKWRSSTKVDIRQNFSTEVETEMNDLIHFLMVGGYQCVAMSAFFDREDVGLFGMAHFAKWCSTEVFQCVRLLMDYIVSRGGCVKLKKIEKPSETEWKSPLDALESFLKSNEMLYDKVVGIHTIAGKQKDGHLNSFLESVIIGPLVASNRQLIVLVSNLKRAGPALGEYQFNTHLEAFLQKVMNDPNLSYVLHGGIDPLNMYNPPANSPVDFSTILNQLINQTPELTSKFSLTDLISLVGNVNIGSLMKPSKTSYYY